MKIVTKVDYYSRTRKGKSPATFTAKQPKGVGTNIQAHIKLDPILKKMPTERKVILQHEKKELREWGSGKPVRVSHHIAQRSTSRDNGFDTKSEFWRLAHKKGR